MKLYCIPLRFAPASKHPMLTTTVRILLMLTLLSLTPSARVLAAPDIPAVEPILLGKPEQSVVEELMTDLKTEPPLLNGAPGRWAYVVASDNIDVMKLMVQNIRKVEGKENIVERTSTLYPILRNRDHPRYRNLLGRFITTPRFSPDGSLILLQFYGPKGIDYVYQPYVLDTRANTLTKVTDKFLRYDLLSWSPNGNYIAYMEGGDSIGDVDFAIFNNVDYIGPLRLYVCEWRTGKKQLVTTDDSLFGPFTWLTPHTLLYNATPKKKPDAPESASSSKSRPTLEKEKAKGAWPVTAPRPNIYLYDIETSASHLLIKDGALPVASPDGKWIAFFGSEDPTRPYPIVQDKRYYTNGGALLLAGSDGTERVALSRESGLYPRVQWLPDSRHLVTVKQAKESPDAEAEVKLWDTESKTFRAITQLYAKDIKKSSPSPIDPKFLPLGATHESLFVRIREANNFDEKHNVTYSIELFKKIDLETGAVTPLAETTQLSDWQPATSP